MKYEVILFDADETLFDFKKSEREAFRKAMIDMGIEYDEDYHFKIYHENHFLSFPKSALHKLKLPFLL